MALYKVTNKTVSGTQDTYHVCFVTFDVGYIVLERSAHHIPVESNLNGINENTLYSVLIYYF